MKESAGGWVGMAAAARGPLATAGGLSAKTLRNSLLYTVHIVFEPGQIGPRYHRPRPFRGRDAIKCGG